VVPKSHDIRVVDAGSSASGETYEYVARRPLAIVGLAEARGMSREVARAAVDRVADTLDTCATDEGKAGRLVEGAARIVAQIGADGRVEGVNVKVDPGDGVAKNAIVCFIAPVKLLTFPPTDAGPRGIALEAMWGRILPASPARPREARVPAQEQQTPHDGG
jgi:hypothetical protein